MKKRLKILSMADPSKHLEKACYNQDPLLTEGLNLNLMSATACIHRETAEVSCDQ